MLIVSCICVCKKKEFILTIDLSRLLLPIILLKKYWKSTFQTSIENRNNTTFWLVPKTYFTESASFLTTKIPIQRTAKWVQSFLSSIYNIVVQNWKNSAVTDDVSKTLRTINFEIFSKFYIFHLFHS